MKKIYLLAAVCLVSFGFSVQADTAVKNETKKTSVTVQNEKEMLKTLENAKKNSKGNKEEVQEDSIIIEEIPLQTEVQPTPVKKRSAFSRIFGRKQKNEWKLVWNDEFSGTELDRSKWSYWENGNPWKDGNYVDENGNLVDQYGFKAKQYYLRENVKIKDGNLVIEVKKENNRTVKVDGVDRKILYSSGAIHTKDLYSVKEGKIEMRAAMPKGIGTWPAFWMWPHDYSQSTGKQANGEIDIFEIYGDNLRRVTGTLHALKPDNTYESFTGSSLKLGKKTSDLTGYHVYGLEWNKNEIKWLFDGKVFKKVSMKSVDRKVANPFNQAYYFMINVALENKTGEDNDIHFPTEMKVDYVRVYKK